MNHTSRNARQGALVTSRKSWSRLGVVLFGIAAVAFGASGLIWGDFATLWQPVRPSVPYRTALSYLFAAGMLLGGIGIQLRRTARPGLVLLAFLYLMAATAWLPRLIGYPQLFGTWSGFAEELAPSLAAMIGFVASLERPTSRWIVFADICRVMFGMCAVAFGVAHFTALAQTADMVPVWLPPGQRFWAVATGLAHFLAGVAIMSGMASVLAARLLAAMFFGFSALIWLPRILATPRNHTTWGGNAINLAMVGASWIVAEWISRREVQREHGAVEAGDSDARTRDRW